MAAVDTPGRLGPAWWAAAALVFVLIATLNAGGYRFGVADQAFYLPAIQRHLDPQSFPRDRLIIDDQDRLNVFTAALAAAVQETGVGTEWLFAAMYLAALGLGFGAAVSMGRELGLSPWARAALAAALTLRHRVGITGVNTLESYGHPRTLAFAIGLWAAVAVLRRRTGVALALVGAAFVVHPTTAIWMGIWVGTAAIVANPRWRWWLTGVAGAAAAASAWVLTAGPLAPQVVPMDAEWRAVIGLKDYLFPTRWPVSGWLMAAAYIGAVFAPFAWRSSRGLAGDAERGLAAGVGALVAIFAISLPFSAAGIAFAVQLQVSRVFWILDVLGTCYLVGLAADGLGGTAGGTTRRRVAIAAVLMAAATARGVYVKWIEHPERPVVRLSLAPTDWRDALAWFEATPVDTHILANPSHAWRYGLSARVGAKRDVYLEDEKDTAMSMYSRRVAMHVLERIRALDGFDGLTTDKARALAARFDLDYLVDERPFDLPVAYRTGRFTVYRLGEGEEKKTEGRSR